MCSLGGPSAYLASLHATSALLEAFLLVTFTSFDPSLLDDVLSCLSKGHDFQPLVGVGALKQKFWEQLRALAAANQLVESAKNDSDRAHWSASTAKESRAWLHGLPISSLGLRLDDHALRIAVGLRLDTPL